MWIIVIVVGLLFPVAAEARECNCTGRLAQLPRDKTSLEAWGEIMAVDRLPNGRVKTRFLVHQLYSGEVKGDFTEVFFAEPCQPKVRVGEKYFVRAHYRRQHANSGFYTNGCAGTRQAGYPPVLGEDGAVVERPADHALSGALTKAATASASACSKLSIEELHASSDLFRITLAPDDDPLVLRPGASDPLSCGARELIARTTSLDLEHPLVVSGSARYQPTPSASAVVWPCEKAPHTCRTFEDAVRAELLNVVAPLTEQQARVLAKQMHQATDGDPSIDIARALCPIDGIDAAESFAKNNKLVGGPIWQGELRAALFECAVTRREFGRARKLLQKQAHEKPQRPGEAFVVGLDWAASRERSTMPMRTDKPTLIAARQTNEPVVVVRQAFARSEHWSNDPLWLEAFAETVVADPDAPPKVRRLGALAYHKAALLRPAAAAQYEAFARELADDDEIAEPLATLRERFSEQQRANEARAAIARRAQHEPQEQLDLEREPPAPPAEHQAEVAAEPAPPESRFDWWSLAKHLLVIVGSLSVVAFLASQGSKRR